MSKPRYDWWGYVKGIIRRYPLLAEEHNDRQSQSVTAAYSSQPGAHEPQRSTENAAMREMPTTRQREYEAVRKAIATTERYRRGQDRLKLIRLVFWDKTHTLQGAALTIPCSERTATEWHGEFIRLVASYYGLLDE